MSGSIRETWSISTYCRVEPLDATVNVLCVLPAALGKGVGLVCEFA